MKKNKIAPTAVLGRVVLLSMVILLTALPAYGVNIQDTSTFIISKDLPADAISFMPGSYGGSQNIDSVVMRAGGSLQGFRIGTRDKIWDWATVFVQQGKSQYSADAIDYNNDGSLSEVLYISGVKSVAVRRGERITGTDAPLWSYTFGSNVYAARATDFDGDGIAGEALVSTGKTIYAVKPTGEGDVIQYKIYSLGFDAFAVAQAGLNTDKKTNDIVAATWVPGATEGEVRDAKIYAINQAGSFEWTFSPQNPNRKVTYLEAFDLNSDGKKSEVIAIFEDPANKLTELYVISEGKQVFSSPGAVSAFPADFDGDGIKDDFFMLTKDTLIPVAGDPSGTPTMITAKSVSRSSLNSSIEKRIPSKLIAVASLSISGKAFNDAAILASMGAREDQEDAIVFFVEDVLEEAPLNISTPTPTPPPSTPPAAENKAPVIVLSPSSAELGTVNMAESAALTISASSSYDPDGNITSYEWTLNSESKGSGKEIELSNLPAGEHELTIKVQDDKGKIAQRTIKITVKKLNFPPTPVVKLLPDKSIFLESEEILFSANDSFDSDGEIKLYEWFDNGKPLKKEKEFKAVLSPGNHTITLKVSDDKGAFDNKSISLFVNIPPTADPGDEIIAKAGEIVKLSGEKSTDKDGSIVSYEWLYNNSLLGKGENLNLTFPAGEYEIVLKIKDNLGAVSSASLKVVVKASPSFFEIHRKALSAVLTTLLGMLFTAAVYIINRRRTYF